MDRHTLSWLPDWYGGNQKQDASAPASRRSHPSRMCVERKPVVRVLGDLVMAVPAFPEEIHVHGHSADVRHVID